RRGVRAPRRPGARDVPQGGHLGWRPREARGARPLRRARRLQDRRARALPVMRSVFAVGSVLGLLLALAPAAPAADFLGDDAEAADRLLADDRHNRRAAVVNDAVRPLGIFSGAAVLAALNPFLLAGSAIDSVVTTAVNLWQYNRLSTPEREALARYGTLLEREPHTRDAPEISRAIRRLGAKRAAA